MTEETTITTAGAKDSTIAGVSIRAWLAVMLVITVCATHFSIVIAVLIEAVASHDFAKVGTFTTIGEPLYSMSVAALGFYFGQKVTNRS